MRDEKKSTGAKKAVMTVILGVACGAAAVMVVAARRPMPTTEVAGDVASTPAVETSAANAAAAPSAEATAAPTAVATTPDAAKPAAKPEKKTPAKAASAKPPVAASVPVQDSSAGTVAAVIPSAAPQAIEEPKAAATLEVPMATVTISGCLEHDGGTFRLKDTDGVAAPKARSWKSGFLKKGSAKIEVIDAANRLKLHDHVGQRVSVSGMLEDREMHARSVQRVSTFCE